MDRRKNTRYRLGVPVIFWWQDAHHAWHEGLGLTRDVSHRGAFVVTTAPPPLQAHIRLKAFLTPAVGLVAPLRMHGEGKVARVEPIKDDVARTGFVMVGKRFVLRRSEE